MSELKCNCVVKSRKPNESQRDWLKRWMCMWHWMETDYFQRKLPPEERSFEIEPYLHESES